MLKVSKVEEPDFIVEFKRKNSPKVWGDYNSEIKNQIKEFILEKEQQGYCAYCERRIHESIESHIEHKNLEIHFQIYLKTTKI